MASTAHIQCTRHLAGLSLPPSHPIHLPGRYTGPASWACDLCRCTEACTGKGSMLDLMLRCCILKFLIFEGGAPCFHFVPSPVNYPVTLLHTPPLALHSCRGLGVDLPAAPRAPVMRTTPSPYLGHFSHPPSPFRSSAYIC